MSAVNTGDNVSVDFYHSRIDALTEQLEKQEIMTGKIIAIAGVVIFILIYSNSMHLIPLYIRYTKIHKKYRRLVELGTVVALVVGVVACQFLFLKEVGTHGESVAAITLCMLVSFSQYLKLRVRKTILENYKLV